MSYLRLPIRKNFVETEDDLIQFGQMANYEFVNIGPSIQMEIKHKTYLLYISIFLDEIQTTHTRKVYAILDAFGDFGGIKEVLLLIIGIVLNPLN